MTPSERAALEAARDVLDGLVHRHESFITPEIETVLALIDAALHPPTVGLGSRYGGAIGRLLDGEELPARPP